MIDEKALEAAMDAYCGVHLDERFERTIEQKVKATIEAYEAAKWRPIEEAPRDGTVFYIWLDRVHSDPQPLQARYFWIKDRQFIESGTFSFEVGTPPLEGAMFRTIEPPQANASKSSS